MTNDIKKGLENLPKSTPPDMVWEGIERKLDENKPRRIALWIKYTIGAAASLLLLAAAWFMLNRVDDISEQTAVNAPSSSPQGQTNIAPVDTAVLTNTIEDTAITTEAETTQVATNYADSSITTVVPFLTLKPPTAMGATTNMWSFGDGSKSNYTTLHSYSNSGSYTINSMSRTYRSDNENIGFLDLKTQGTLSLGNEAWGENNFRGNRNSLGLVGDTIGYFVEPYSSESYAPLIENEYQSPLKEPLSTFSIDVDNASYSNIRRMLREGQKPPKDAVRIEEFVNYFDYNYSLPTNNDPFAIHLETATCPWNEETKVVSIGIQGKDIPKDNLPASNLVFLIDVSGSMADENKLPLVKQSLKLLAGQMSSKDNIAIVTYAGAAGLALPSTPANKLLEIKTAIDNLESGGSTAGGEGIELAYKVAKENLKPNGNNRIILVTDGDFNVGRQTDTEMEKLIEAKRKEGIFLTVCGFGMGNYKDSKMEILADKGNGNYFYIDNYNEGKKVFVTDLRGTLFTIAKDVKIQVEFNPKLVKAYRLIGYENRQMAAQDFDDDTKDAGELGAGHTVTALYEVIPAGSNAPVPGFTELKYQPTPQSSTTNAFDNEMLTVKLRYKQPDGETSKLLVRTLNNNGKSYSNASDNLRYACGVTAYAMVLRDSKFKGKASYTLAKQLLQSTNLNKENGYRDELLELITLSEKLTY